MMGSVHACIGAGVGSFFESRAAAFAAGVASHAVSDACPHRDLDNPIAEAVLAAGVLIGIGCWKGAGSPEFWGAIGGLAPDLEHGLVIAGLMDKEREVFPTHIADGKWHGDESGTERVSQLLLSAAALVAVALRK